MKNIIIFVFILISRFASVVIRLSEYRKIGPGPIERFYFPRPPYRLRPLLHGTAPEVRTSG